MLFIRHGAVVSDRECCSGSVSDDYPLPVATDYPADQAKEMAEVIDKHLDLQSKLLVRPGLSPKCLCEENKVLLASDLAWHIEERETKKLFSEKPNVSQKTADKVMRLISRYFKRFRVTRAQDLSEEAQVRMYLRFQLILARAKETFFSKVWKGIKAFLAA